MRTGERFVRFLAKGFVVAGLGVVAFSLAGAVGNAALSDSSQQGSQTFYKDVNRAGLPELFVGGSTVAGVGFGVIKMLDLEDGSSSVAEGSEES